MSENKRKLLDKISARAARVGVVGLGYVGLPLVVEFARGGFNSTGFEVDAKKVDAINRGESYIPDAPTAQVAEMVEAKTLGATTDFALLKDQDVIIICVPTPLRKTKDPDVSYILAASEKIQTCLRPGQLIILESTTYPGTTDEVLRPMFDATGLRLDEDYFLAFSPERVDPGNEKFNTKNITKVVGGVTETSAEVAAAVYGAIVDKVHPVSSARVAETCKLLENTFRAVNIGLVNELARLCDTLGIDTWEVIAAAATKPFGFMPFYPGPGIGGHCLVGDEAVVVRSADDSRKRLILFETLFDKVWADPLTKKLEVDGADVISEPRLEALSLNTETNLPEWRPVSALFRRLYQGNLVTITTGDNRRVTVTEKHPMLVADAYGRTQRVFAKNIVRGDRLPIHCSSLLSDEIAAGTLAPVASGSLRGPLEAPNFKSHFDKTRRALKSAGLLLTTPVESVEITKTEQPVRVYSIEVEETHTFVTSYGIYVHNCIPLDPHYLSWKARMHGFEARFISLAEEVNSRMPDHVVDLVTRGLNNHRKPVNGSKVLIIGVAYKRDIDDMRESPALGIIEKLQFLGADVQFHDPYVEEIYLEGTGHLLRGIELSSEAVSEADCVVIVTDHRKVDYAWLIERAKLVVDTRNTTRGLSDFEEKIIRL